MQRSASKARAGVAAFATLTGLTMSPLLGCGGLAADGRHLVADDDVRAEALPERFADCDALRAYASTQARELLAVAPTGSPLEPLFEPGGAAGFEQPAYAEWPEAARQPGGGRTAYARRAEASEEY